MRVSQTFGRQYHEVSLRLFAVNAVEEVDICKASVWTCTKEEVGLKDVLT